MKNIHILKTPNPSRLSYDFDINQYYLQKETSFWEHQNMIENRNIYITNSEEIKEGDWWINLDNNKINSNDLYNLANKAPSCKKIILTTDVDLIKDGVQEIGNGVIEWLIKNPTCEEVETERFYSMSQSSYSGIEYEIIIPKEEPKQETLEEAAHKILVDYGIKSMGQSIGVLTVKKLMVDMAKWQQEQDKNKYSEEDMKRALKIPREVIKG